MKDIKAKRLQDAEARTIVKTQISKNIMVEAGAGSGKTSAMAARFVELVSSNHGDLSEVVAITFTKKAANELKERIRGELNKIGSPLASQLHRCFIGTIHAFCSKLLRERPIEAGVDPQFIEIEEGEDKRIRNLAWEEYVMNADQNRKLILSKMELFDLSNETLKRFLHIVCDNPDLEFELPDEEKIDIDRFTSQIDLTFEALRELIYHTLANIPELEEVSAGKRDALQLTLYICLPKLERKQALSTMEKLILLKWFNTSTRIKVTQKCWGDDKESKQLGKEIGEAFAEFKSEDITMLFKLRAEYAYNYVAVPFVKEAKIIYEARKKALGLLNFQDLLQGATDVLRDYPEVRQYFQNKYKVLLVDEFQDTDPVQAKMLMYLTGQELEEKNWEKITPLPGSLFVVGDPKQSIYGFRRADIDVYNKFKEIVLRAGGEKAELTTNFRSVGQLGSWYNEIFPTLLLPSEDGARQAEFSKIDTVKESLPGTISGVYKYKVDEKAASTIQSQDVHHTERIIKYLTGGKSITVAGDIPGTYTEKKIEYKDIMILFLKKASLTYYGKQLSEAGIPVKAVGADVVTRTPQFKAFSDIIRMLAYPEENALLYKVLRGSAFRFTDSELFRFNELGGNMNIYSNLNAVMEGISFPAGDKNQTEEDENNYRIFVRLKDAFNLLKTFAYYMKNMVPAAATERIISELGITARMLYTPSKLSELSSFTSLIEKIRMNKLTNVWDLNQFIDEINIMIESGYEEELELEGENYNAVKMMNLHKAKGLEAPVVILAAPYSGKVKQPNLYVDRSKEFDDKVYGVARLKLKESFYNKEYIGPAYWEAVKDMALARDIAEKDRLLYVAATRAENLLIISDSGSADNPWLPLLAEIESDSSKTDEQSKLLKDIDRILLDEGFEIGDKNLKTKSAEKSMESEITLAEILKRTQDTFSEIESSYQNYTPSEKKRKKDISAENDEALNDFEINPDLILENSMEVYFEGDREVFRSLRTEIGTAIHKVFEGLIKGDRDNGQIINYVANQTGNKEINEKLLMMVASRFMASNLWQRIKAADAVYTEVPISIKLPAGNSFSGTQFDQDCYVTGSIDLIFLEAGGWTIVDYKTCAKTEVKSELVKLYQSQLDAYKEAWELATNEKVEKTEIFFVEKM